MGRRDARGLGQNSDFGTIYLHYTIVSRKSQIKMRTRRAKSRCFSARGGRKSILGYFFPKPARKFFFAPSCPRTFPHCRPPATTVSTGKCGKLCGNCEKPLSPCGFSLSPVFQHGFRLCKRTCLFFLFRTKIAVFLPEKHPQDTGGIWPFPALSVSSGKGANFFPHSLSTGI